MQLKITSWNIEGRLSEVGLKRRGSSDQIIASIKKLDADVVVLLEAHSEASLDNLESSQQLIEMGYYLYNAPYQDDTPMRTDTNASLLSLMLLSKLPVDEFKIIRLADLRNALVAILHDPKTDKQFRVIGVHLDDRAEATRLQQINDLSKIINQSNLPTIVVGDFNAMHGKDLWPAKLLGSKSAQLLANFILPSITLRAIEMTRGETLNLLQSSTSLRDADPHHRPTTTPKMRGLEWLPSVRLIQIDHIFISTKIEVKKFQIASDGGADHRAISATLIIN
jgi:endonuclease/exonuclease/phosphatase family metal-dependent hydrolase